MRAARAAPDSSQRRRLLDAMVAAAARYGYGGASVARVVKEAGVSRATFYELFEDRDSCFLAAYRSLAEAIQGAIPDNAQQPLGELIQELLSEADRSPAAARVALIEGLAGDASVRTEHEAVWTIVEDRLEAYLAVPPGGAAPLQIPARALMGGVTGVVAPRIFRGEAGHLEELRDDLLAWIDSYALPSPPARLSLAAWREKGAGLSGVADEALGLEVLGRTLPRGRGALSPARVAKEQRLRILAAVAELSREKGYSATTVADIVAVAGITREAFYDQFRDKDDAFLATQAFGLEASVAFTAARFFARAEWPDRVWDGLEALLSYVSGQKSLMYVELIEVYAAGNAAIHRSFESRMAYTLFLEEGYRQGPDGSKVPRLVSEAISGVIQELFRNQIVIGRGENMLELLPLIAYLTLTPFIGAASALDLVEAKVGEPARDRRGSPARG
ncbi:MAG TPA: TetR/AcrR family transcriptional regulator [Solirubrobacterales bacterium]|nr:TetR/AcrR family transcriptional regulator [Solirubrobacterales bacterium]